METTIAKTRDLIQDNLKNGYDLFEYLTSSVFTLSESNIDESTIAIFINGVDHTGSGEWSFDSNTNKITIEGLVVSDIVEVHYQAYIKYSDNEIKSYIRAAFVYISVEKYADFTIGSAEAIVPVPTEAEDNLIALVASILIAGSIRSYRTPEISINFEDTMSKEQKIKFAVRKYKKLGQYLDYVDLKANMYHEEDEL